MKKMLFKNFKIAFGVLLASLFIAGCPSPNTEPENIPTPPGAVRNLTVLTAEKDSILISWENPTDKDFTGCNIKVLSGMTVLNEVFVPMMFSSFEFNNLTPNTIYIIEVQAVNSSGLFSESNTISAKTKSAEKDPSSDDPSGDDPSGDDPSGDNPSGEDPSGDNPSGENPIEIDEIGIEIVEGSTTYITPGDVLKLKAVYTPEDATETELTWSLSDLYGCVSFNKETLTLTAIKEGEADIFVFTKNYMKSASLNIKICPAIASFELSSSTEYLSLEDEEYKTEQLFIFAYDEDDYYIRNESLPFIAEWTSSDETVATVENGLVTAKSTGNVTITCKLGELTKTCTFTVKDKIIYTSSFKFDETIAYYKVGETFTIPYTVDPENANMPLALKPKMSPYYDTESDILQVNEDGSLTALQAGTAYVYAKYLVDNYSTETSSSYCMVIIQEPITDFTITENEYTLDFDDEKLIDITFEPSNGYTKDLTFTSSNSKISVNEEGLITASSIEDGKQEAVITISCGGITKTVYVTVLRKVTGLSLNKNFSILGLNGTETISATITPSDATNQTVLWTTSDASIATIDNGLITAKQSGTATITATVDNISVSYPVLVLNTSSTFNMVQDSELVTLPDGYITDAAGLVAYKYTTAKHAGTTGLPSGYGKWDIKGNQNGTWQSSTYTDAGWGYKINDTTVSLNSNGYATADNLSLSVKPILVYNKGIPFVLFVYVLTNNGTTDLTGQKIGTGTDVQIAGNDRAPVNATEYGANLIDNNTNMVFSLNCLEGEAVTPVDTMWLGNYNQGAMKNVYTDKRDSISNIDSALAFSWQNIDIKAGESKIFTVRLTFVVDQGGTLQALVY